MSWVLGDDDTIRCHGSWEVMTLWLKWILGGDDTFRYHGSWEVMLWLWWILVDDDTMAEMDSGR